MLSNDRNAAAIHGGSALDLVGGDSDNDDDSDDSAGLSPDIGARGWADQRALLGHSLTVDYRSSRE